MSLDVVVVDRANLATVRATLDERLPGGGFQKVRNAPGTGKVTLANTDPDLAQPRYGDLLRFDVDGTTRFMAIVEKKTKADVAQSEEAGQATEISGRGHLAIVARALVFPEFGGVGPASDTRPFHFASSYLDDSGWPAAVQIAQRNAGSSPWGSRKPKGWPGDPAYWIWGQAAGVGSPPQPVGDCYFRTTFTLAAEKDLRWFWSADDAAEIWVDNVNVAQAADEYMWGTTKQFPLFLGPGTHQIAVKATNADRPGNAATNIAGFIMSVYSTTNGGDLDTVILHTDNTWKTLAYPADPPGFTVAHAIRILLEEWADRGGLTIALTFTDADDTASEGWDTTPDLSCRVGDNLLMVIGQLVEAGYVNVEMTADAFELNAYADDTTAATVTFEPAVNVTELTHEGSIA